MLLYLAIIGIISAAVCWMLAKSRNRNPVLWAVLGLVFGILAIIVLAFLKAEPTYTASTADVSPSSGPAPLLAVKDVSVVFGGIVALNGVSFDLQKGQILGLIGPNGAGKTTLFNCLSRLYQPSKGDILMEGSSILTRPVHEIAKVGIGRTFQNVSLFQNMSVLDNVRIGMHSHTTTDAASDALQLPWVRRTEKQINDRVGEIIDYLQLNDVANRVVAGLPFGTQKRVELARALAAEPKILLLDEPAGGLNHEEVYVLGDLIKAIRKDRDITVLLVEHHMGLVMSIADHVVALNFGKKLAEGTPAQVQQNPDVIKAYLGDGTK